MIDSSKKIIIIALTLGALAIFCVTDATAASYDLDASGSMENSWQHWNSSNTILDLASESGWAYFTSKPINPDWGMSFYNFTSGIQDVEPPYAIKAHFKQDPPDGEGGYLQVLTICYSDTGNPGQGYAMVAGKGYYGLEQRIIAFSDQG